MNMQAALKLELGFYRLYWKTGGSSIAAVGQLYDGRRWFAPCNWTSVSTMGIASTNWRDVQRAQHIKVIEQ